MIFVRELYNSLSSSRLYFSYAGHCSYVQMLVFAEKQLSELIATNSQIISRSGTALVVIPNPFKSEPSLQQRWWVLDQALCLCPIIEGPTAPLHHRSLRLPWRLIRPVKIKVTKRIVDSPGEARRDHWNAISG